MIRYNPIDGDAITNTLPVRPRYCFLMTQLGGDIDPDILNIRADIERSCSNYKFQLIDASSATTGRDFLLKIWNLIASVPLVVGIVHDSMPLTTQQNIFYELGVAQAFGKESLLIKSERGKIPSDLVRTEYVEYGVRFNTNFEAYLASLFDQAQHYVELSEYLEQNPLLAMDYLKRAYLITGDPDLKVRANELMTKAGFDQRAKNSIEYLASEFSSR